MATDMATDMGHMGIHKKNISRFFILLFCFYQTNIWARNWQLEPSLTIREIYSDNVRLDSENEIGAFVTEVSPGLTFTRETARNRLNLNYRLENLYNAGGDEKYDLNHQLQFNSKTEFFRNSLFLDLNSSINQQNISNIRASNDNITGSENRTTVTTYGFSPYWTPHFHGYVDGEVRFRYENFSSDRDETSLGDNQSSDTGLGFDSLSLSDSETFEESIHLVSGWRFSRVTWAVNFVNREQIRERGNDIIFRNADGLIKLHLSREYSLFAKIGHSDNTFQTQTDRNKNGFFYTVGGEWRPSQRFGIEAGIGNNSYVTVNISPTRHMHWTTTYRDNDIGTNTGSTWETDFEFETRRSNWKASYSEETTTVQTVLADSRTFNTVTNIPNQRNQRNLSLPNLVDEVFIRKRGEISFSYQTVKTDINARIFNEKRTFQVSKNKDDVIGMSADINWRFARRSSFFARSTWQKTTRSTSALGADAEETGTDSIDNRFDFSLGLTRIIPIRLGNKSLMNGRIEYRYQNQTSDDTLNEFQENRITGSLEITL
jgi:hypothetical protein